MKNPKLVIIAIALALLSVSMISYQIESNAIVNGQSSLPTKTPIKHIIYLIQENHSFDNLFGTFPGLPSGYALNLSTCMPEKPPNLTPCQKPFNANNIPSVQQT